MKSESSKIPLVHVTSLGCSKNWVDTEIMMADLLQNQFGFAQEPNHADLWLINTCGFIASARKETNEFIEKAIKWKSKKAHRKIIITGCINSYDTEKEYPKTYPQVDLWLHPNEVPVASKRIAQVLNNEEVIFCDEATPYLYNHTTARLQLTPEHYAYIKITDGCDNNCSYCAIPKIRGRSRSRTIDSVVEEAKSLIKNGVKELILIGQDITRFGYDLTQKSQLTELVRALDNLDGDFVLRLLYLHPARYPDDLTDLYANAKHLLPYLEMPLQHIATDILNSMNRCVTPDRIKSIFKTLKEKVPKIALRTTFIIGYPGETESDFEQILTLMREVEFDRVGAFVFQPEPNTPAANLANPVDLKVAESRYRKLMELQSGISLKKNQALMGQSIRVLLDEVDEVICGRTYRDAPDIDNVVYIDPGRRRVLEPGMWVDASVVEVAPYEMVAKIISQKPDRKNA